jgi:hypothetical protein
MLQNVSGDFLVFAKSSMDEKLKQGILVGRPFGGVAVLVRRRLCNLITFCGCGCDDDGRVISAKLACDNFHLLLFGCYFPCSDHTNNYCHILGDVSRLWQCGYDRGIQELDYVY